MNIAIIGPSGAGKGSHAATLCARYILRHVSTGDLFRHHVQTRSALGILARRYMAQGDLVPDEIVEAMIEEWADKLPPAKGVLFDGFPRTTDQVRFLDELLGRLNRAIDAVVYLQVSDEEIVRRLSGRLICRVCQAPYHTLFQPPQNASVCDRCGGALYQRPDDSPEMVRTRLRVFHRTTGPVLDHYAAANKLIILPGEGTSGEVEARMLGALDALQNRLARFATREEAAAISAVPGAPVRPAPAARPTVDIVLLGGPGSGKGTQAERLCAELKLLHVATGDLFRDNLRQATELGRLAKTYMDRGELVPDDVTDAMVEERLARPDAHDGFILDGYPRTTQQAVALTEMLTRLRRRLAGVLYINVSDAAIVDRLSGRMICRSCQAPYHQLFKPPNKPGICDGCGGELYQRADDNPETVRARLVTFHRQTEPLIDYYRPAGLLHEIDGEGDVAGTCGRSLAAVRNFPTMKSPSATTAAAL
ncbi:MAG: adenylate kinase [Verrucomicrobia bacterium]|nr:adenylate kinase [Verrucomicrobiota bacterium]